ncbi:MAG: hypothetical protein Q4G70_11825 [Pseudomonadota bacterium]|nr:hypothetical protein [Pseudomonadota bacterium]
MKRAFTSLAFLALIGVSGCASRGVDAGPPDRAPVTVTMPAQLSDADFAPWLEGERARVAATREAVQQRFHDAELACWRRFAVNDCVRRARLERRGKLADLRQEELLLNELERKRRTEERLRQLEQKQQKAAP